MHVSTRIKGRKFATFNKHNTPSMVDRKLKIFTPLAWAVARKFLPLAYNNSGNRLHTMATRLEGMFASPSFKIFVRTPRFLWIRPGLCDHKHADV